MYLVCDADYNIIALEIQEVSGCSAKAEGSSHLVVGRLPRSITHMLEQIGWASCVNLQPLQANKTEHTTTSRALRARADSLGFELPLMFC